MRDPAMLAADYYAAFNARDLGWYDPHFQDGVTVLGPGTPGWEDKTPARGVEVIKTFDAGFWRAFPDCVITIERRAVDGDTVLLENHFVGTHSGPLATPMGDLPATGRVLDRTYAVRLTVQGDRIGEIRLFFDRLTILSDLGVPLAPAMA